MKKRLILIVLTMVLLIGRAEALTLTQRLGNEYVVTSVDPGDQVKMTFTSKVGFKFKNWIVSGVTGVDTTNPTLNFAIGNQNVVVEGKYVDKYTVTFNSNGGEGSMANQGIPALGSEKLNANTFSKEGHTFSGWAESANGDKVYDDEENVTPDKDLELYAVWEEEIIGGYTITTTSNVGGTITPTIARVAEGGNATIVVTPNSGYLIKEIEVDNGSGKAVSTYVTDDVFTIENDATYPWIVSGNEFISGTDATSACTIKLNGQGILSFDYRMNSQGTFNYLTIEVTDETNGTETVADKITVTESGTYSKAVSGEITIQLTYSARKSGPFFFTGFGAISNLSFGNEPCKIESNGSSKNIIFNNVTSNHTVDVTFGTIADIPVGAYIEYTPASGTVTALGTDTGYGTYDSTTGNWTWQDQTFDPSKYTDGWRVLYNNNGEIQIISAENVLNKDTKTNLTLGTSGSASNNEDANSLDGGKLGYAKAIYTLNKFCSDYATGDIADPGKGRAPGYNGGPDNVLDEITDLNGDGEKNVKDISHANLRKVVTEEGYYLIIPPWGDSYNSTETSLITSKTSHSSGIIWLALRCVYSDSGYSYFGVRLLYSNGSVYDCILSSRDSYGYSNSNASSYGVRPIITLKSGLKVIDGEGTFDSPYVLSF